MVYEFFDISFLLFLNYLILKGGVFLKTLVNVRFILGKIFIELGVCLKDGGFRYFRGGGD